MDLTEAAQFINRVCFILHKLALENQLSDTKRSEKMWNALVLTFKILEIFGVY